MSASSFTSYLITCVALLQIRNGGQSSTTARPGLQQTVDDWMAKKAAGAVVVTIVTPSVTKHFYSGNLEVHNKTLPDEHTLFEIASITKGFTALLLADQVLAGTVFLNDTLDKLLTDWPGRFSSAAGNITLLELTTHSSGLPVLPDNVDPRKYPNPYIDYTKTKLYEWLDKVELPNRGSFLYSNIGVGILGHLLANVAGKKYEDFLKERVLLPLGLNDTTITLSGNQKSRLAPGHDENGTVVAYLYYNIFEPAGGLLSSISEFAHFLRFTAGVDENEKDKRLHEALEFAVQPRGKVDQNFLENTTIGCNWMLRNDKPFVYHPGSTAGYNAFIGWNPEQQVGIGVLASVAPSNDTDSTSVLGLDLLEAWNCETF